MTPRVRGHATLGRATLALTGLVLTGLTVAALPAGLTPPAHAADEDCSVTTLTTTERLKDVPRRAPNAAAERMGVERAHELATGRGSKVVVIDSGIQPLPGLDRRPLWAHPGVSRDQLLSGHGTLVAGLIAGPDGVAPAASVYDVQVFDSEDADTTEGQQELTSEGLVQGIRAVIAAHQREQFDVVNISLAMARDDPALGEAVADLVARDVVVVAAAGNQPDTATEGFEGTPRSDARVFPADYPGVLAVGAVPPGDDDPRPYVVPNADTDVAAPTAGAISANVNGQRCRIAQVATSWAAAEVSGLLALLRERFPDETPAQLVARLQSTTEGAGVTTPVTGAEAAVVDPWTGAGVVQAHDALTREVDPGRGGEVEQSVPEAEADAQAPLPPPDVDLFGTSRARLLWFGLLGGALLALASMLRPLLRQARERR